MVQIAYDIVEANGKTIKQNNLEKGHSFPIGSIVETFEGLRLFVVDHTRDCDGTPLYSLSFNKDAQTKLDEIIKEMATIQNDMEYRLAKLVEFQCQGAIDRGYAEENLVGIE